MVVKPDWANGIQRKAILWYLGKITNLPCQMCKKEHVAWLLWCCDPSTGSLMVLSGYWFNPSRSPPTSRLGTNTSFKPVLSFLVFFFPYPSSMPPLKSTEVTGVHHHEWLFKAFLFQAAEDIPRPALISTCLQPIALFLTMSSSLSSLPSVSSTFHWVKSHPPPMSFIGQSRWRHCSLQTISLPRFNPTYFLKSQSASVTYGLLLSLLSKCFIVHWHQALNVTFHSC